MKLTKEQKQEIRKIVDEIAYDETIKDGKTVLIIKLNEIGLSHENPKVARQIFNNLKRLKAKDRKEKRK